jgi:hypothetical protein
MNDAEKKYNECVELLYSLHDVITVVCQLTNVRNKTAMQILKESVDSMEEYNNATPEEKAVIEAETDKIFEMLEQELGEELQVTNNRKKKTKKPNKDRLN